MRITIDIRAPVGAVYDQWSRFPSLPGPLAGMQRIAHLTEHPPEPIRSWAIEATGFSGVVAFYRVSDTDTRVTVRLPDPALPVDLAGQPEQSEQSEPRRTPQDRVRVHLERFKAFVEGSARRPPAPRAEAGSPPDAVGWPLEPPGGTSRLSVPPTG